MAVRIVIDDGEFAWRMVDDGRMVVVVIRCAAGVVIRCGVGAACVWLRCERVRVIRVRPAPPGERSVVVLLVLLVLVVLVLVVLVLVVLPYCNVVTMAIACLGRAYNGRRW